MTILETISLEDQIKKIAKDEGVALVGICSADSIKDKEFSDPNYLLPGSKSVISIAINYSDEVVRKYLTKDAREPLNIEETGTVKNLKRIGEKIKIFLQEKGYKAVNCDLNFDYRKNQAKNKAAIDGIKMLIDLINKKKDNSYQMTKNEERTLERLKRMIFSGIRNTDLGFMPELSHKCVAVAAGLGRIGWSGNLITEKYGARVTLNSVITTAKLKPDKTLEKNPCTKCKICEKSCQAGLFSKDESQKITIAGIEETIAKRNSHAYCLAICPGMKGQNRFKGWSTWSQFGPVSLPLDDTIDDFARNLIVEAFQKGGKEADNMFKFIRLNNIGLHNKPNEDLLLTCSFCQLVCSGANILETKNNYELLTNSGCVNDLYE